VTIEEEEEIGVANPDLHWVRFGEGFRHQESGVSDQEVRRWASQPDQEEEQQLQSPQ
jgi:hypothetical protein